MRHYFILIACALAPLFSAAQNTKTVKASVERATVFTQGAQLFSNSPLLNLQSGSTDVVFENVSPQLLGEFLQATATGEAVVMDVQYHLKYADNVTPPKPDDSARRKVERQIEAVNDSIFELGFKQRFLAARTEDLRIERNVLVSNRLMRGEYQRDSLALFKQSIEFLRARLNDIDQQTLQIEYETYQINKQKYPLEQRRNALQILLNGNFQPQAGAPQPIPQVIVTVFAERPLSTTIGINYYVPQAGWTASYDLRAKGSTTDIELNHKASVWQQTGVDWKDVLLTLSTGNPNQNSVKPTLAPVQLAFYNPYAYQNNRQLEDSRRAVTQQKDIANAANAPAGATLDEVVVSEFEAKDDNGVDRFTTVTENLLRVEYEINLKYTIESGPKPHNVVIQQRKLPATYNYAAVPKLDPDVFLMARVTNWENLNLMPGEARIFFDGSFVGETMINPNSTGDTLLLNLGRDKNIVVKRLKVADKSKERILNDNREVTKTFEITVRNTKTLPIRLVIEDQMPISNDSAIKIEYLEDSKAKFNPNTGKLTWDFKLDPRETRKLVFSYEVRHPKDKVVANL